ncbi:MAG TPA: hypothetical protein VGO47_01880, partial [Chlamydiales bacterium]|nr:hypothetical protein [Chlamydiales bacterium]
MTGRTEYPRYYAKAATICDGLRNQTTDRCTLIRTIIDANAYAKRQETPISHFYSNHFLQA